MKGFSLIELLVVLGIISILAGIAYPHYQNHFYQSRRLDGQLALFHLASAMERYYMENQTYAGATFATLGATNISPQQFYQLSFIANDTDYTLIATPLSESAQANDHCSTLTLTDKNIKGPSLACWGGAS